MRGITTVTIPLLPAAAICTEMEKSKTNFVSKALNNLSAIALSSSDEAALQQVVEDYFWEDSDEESVVPPTGTPLCNE